MGEPGAAGQFPTPDELYAAWRDGVSIDLHPELVNPAEPFTGARVPVPAAYIRKAALDHVEGRHKLHSGLRIVGCTFDEAVHLDGLEMKFPLWFNYCLFKGPIHATGASLRGLSLIGCSAEKGIDLRNSKIVGGLFLRGAFEASGPVLLRDMKVEGAIDLRGARFLYDGKSELPAFFDAAEGDCLGLSRTEAASIFWGKDPPPKSGEHRPDVADAPPAGKVTLRDLRVHSFRHDFASHGLASWPAEGALALDGFTYERIEDAPLKTLIDWMGRQGGSSPTPYFTLATVLERQGLKEDAVRVRSQVRRNEVARYPLLKRLAAHAVFYPIDYGASSSRALWILLAVALLHLLALNLLQESNRIAPAIDGMLTQSCYYGEEANCAKALPAWRRVPIAGPRPLVRYVPPDYPPFSAPEYSLEAFVPVLDFGQHRYWVPIGRVTKLMLDLAALLGLFLGSLFVASVGGWLMPRQD